MRVGTEKICQFLFKCAESYQLARGDREKGILRGAGMQRRERNPFIDMRKGIRKRPRVFARLLVLVYFPFCVSAKKFSVRWLEQKRQAGTRTRS